MGNGYSKYIIKNNFADETDVIGFRLTANTNIGYRDRTLDHS